MTPGELKAIIGVMCAIIGYFLIREFTKKDKIGEDLKAFESRVTADIQKITDRFTNELGRLADRNSTAIEGLGRSVSELALALAEQKAFLAETYVTKVQHDKDLGIIHARISKHAQRLDDLEPCTYPDCPKATDADK